jgi:uncharacterized protein
MTFLPDVNVWLALASQRHTHSALCGEWLDTVAPDGAVFCRVTQMGLLRLLTNATVMGDDVVTSRDAWRAYRHILADERIGFAPEPFALEDYWRKLTSLDRPTPKLWTDAYLTAFARTGGLRLVTLDRAIGAMAPDALMLR